jgi:hypothetical protein
MSEMEIRRLMSWEIRGGGEGQGMGDGEVAGD